MNQFRAILAVTAMASLVSIERVALAQSCTTVGGCSNTVSASEGTVSGGSNNDVAATFGAIGGGYDNTIVTSTYSNICGGGYNYISGTEYNSIGGGYDNSIDSGSYNIIGGGYYNNIASYVGSDNLIAGGIDNTISGSSTYYASILGGLHNSAQAQLATNVGGGYNNAEAFGSTAMGIGAVANAPYCTVIQSDASYWTYGFSQTCTVNTNTAASGAFVVRASGGVQFVTGINTSTGAITAGMYLGSGSGAWASLSDREAKKDLGPGLIVRSRPEGNYRRGGVLKRHAGSSEAEGRGAWAG